MQSLLVGACLNTRNFWRLLLLLQDVLLMFIVIWGLGSISPLIFGCFINERLKAVGALVLKNL